MNNLIQMNRFSELHEFENIIFCKRDFILDEYVRISKLNYDVVLLVLNSDYSFTEDLLRIKPNNVKHIFATNSTVYNDVVTPLPIGVENDIEPKRIGHGMINHSIFEKLPYLTGEIPITKNQNVDKLYANFNIYTNFQYRNYIKNICSSSEYINFEYGLSYSEYVKRMKEHIAVVSPTGNGLECIRTYETLYLDSIPVCVGDYNQYRAIIDRIYKNLPVVFISNPHDLTNLNYIKSEINKVKNNSKEMLDYQYWINEILRKVKK